MSMVGHDTAISGSFYLMFLGFVFATIAIWGIWGKDVTLLSLTGLLLFLLVRDYKYG